LSIRLLPFFQTLLATIILLLVTTNDAHHRVPVYLRTAEIHLVPGLR
jgi:hypothetical protein